MTSLDHLLEIASLILAAYILGCVLGYAAHRYVRHVGTRQRTKTIAIPSATPRQPAGSAARRLARLAEVEPARAAVLDRAPRPPELPGPRPGGPDDLKKIKGIGAKTEVALNNHGIYHFDQIAGWNGDHIQWLEGRVAVKDRIRREQWVEQATLLATATVSSPA